MYQDNEERCPNDERELLTEKLRGGKRLFSEKKTDKKRFLKRFDHKIFLKFLIGKWLLITPPERFLPMNTKRIFERRRRCCFI